MNATAAAHLPLWRPHKKGLLVELLLSPDGLAVSDQPDPDLSGFDLRPGLLDENLPISAQLAQSAQAVILEVKKDYKITTARLGKLMSDMPGLPVIAALHDPSLADVRQLMRLGVSDVLPLPLRGDDLRDALDRLRDDLESRAQVDSGRGTLVSIIKSVGGVGATAILSQLAAEFALRESRVGREVCLVDLDIQLGSASLYLGALPEVGLKDLLEAGSRADGELLRSVTSVHSSGLHFIAAPPEMMPMESVGADQIVALLDLASREFETVFVDLPANWTNWSFSALARSDAVLLVSELSVASLRQTRRQIELIGQQGLADIPLHIVMNRVDKKLFRSISMREAERAIGRNVEFTIANDFATVSTALDQGLLVSEVNKRSRVAKDLSGLADAMATITAKVPG